MDLRYKESTLFREMQNKISWRSGIIFFLISLVFTAIYMLAEFQKKYVFDADAIDRGAFVFIIVLYIIIVGIIAYYSIWYLIKILRNKAHLQELNSISRFYEVAKVLLIAIATTAAFVLGMWLASAFVFYLLK